jgi:hypothetical protein
MKPKAAPNYLAGYAPALSQQITQLIAEQKLAKVLLTKYPKAHAVRTDRALYDYVMDIKNQFLRKVGTLNKVAFDSKLHITHSALGTHTSVSRAHGHTLLAKREIRVATVFKDMPDEFLRMIVVHELAHSKEHDHNKAFYQLCQHMQPNYHQIEFEVRAYLTYLDANGAPLW